ncbi:TPA: 50S ribosomal protein L19e [Candidatus Woesearchaeota archaeon]|nr:50S ribosomal protein L19e [Candidatus Woesearchaeota archaeon]
MMLGVQKRLAAGILGCSKKRVVFSTEKLADIKEAITKADIRALIEQGVIRKVPARGISRSRISNANEQRKKDKRKGHGSRKGAAGARTNKKSVWVAKVRLQRRFLKRLKTGKAIKAAEFVDIYRKIKGGFFRSRRHMQLYLTEKGIMNAAVQQGKENPSPDKQQKSGGGN